MATDKIQDGQLYDQGRFHSCLDDLPDKSADEMKAFMDYIPRQVIIPKVNEVIDALQNKSEKEDVYTKEQSNLMLDGKADKSEVYSKSETDSALLQKANVSEVYTKNEAELIFCASLEGRMQGNPLTVTDMIEQSCDMTVLLESKNILPYPYHDSSKTVNGITFTVLPDGGININGTASGAANFVLFGNMEDPSLKGLEADELYTISCKTDKSITGCYLVINYYNQPPKSLNYLSWVMLGLANTSSKSAYFPSDGIGVRAYINISSGAYFDNVTLYPMFERGNTATDYTMYRNDLSGIEVTVSANGQSKSVCSDSEGRIFGIKSSFPSMTLSAAEADTVISCSYKKDINKAFAQLKSIIAGGGL